MDPEETEPRHEQDVPPDYATAAQLVTLFGCVPLGLRALAQSRQVLVRHAMGDLAGALEASRQARRYCVIASVAGAMIWGLAVAVVVLLLRANPAG